MLRLIVVLCSISTVTALPGLQAIAVKGKLICDNKPATDVLIKLYDKDIVIDTKLDKKKTDSEGGFEVRGRDLELTRIDPVLNIYHDCNDKFLGVEKPCQRKISFKIPKKYISWGLSSSDVYDIGTIQLSGKFPGESRDCIH